MKLRVLVADDSVLFRRAISEVLASLPDVEVVGSVSNGRLALQKVRDLRPDLLTLDMEMPELDGLAVLDALKKSGDNVSVIVVSALTKLGGSLTMRALQKGAFDFITKPDGDNSGNSREALKRDLGPRIRALSHRLEVRNILRKPQAAVAAEPRPVVRPLPVAAPPPAPERTPLPRIGFSSKPELVLIGVSTGGPTALSRMLPDIPGNIGVPILIVQHMPPVFTQSLAESLEGKCSIKVKEAAHGELLEPNVAYIAPGGRHMRIVPGPNGSRAVQINEDPPENNCRPAVDHLFRSVAGSFPGKAMAVILTGMGSDGTLGLRLLKRHGCFAIAQDEATCVVYGMPKSAVDAGLTDEVLPIEMIGGRIASAVGRWK
jgi:two-component system, chemotaxis family, protein-glutamate methylesterase/glutaminase